jgi:hypothetical protein
VNLDTGHIPFEGSRTHVHQAVRREADQDEMPVDRRRRRRGQDIGGRQMPKRPAGAVVGEVREAVLVGRNRPPAEVEALLGGHAHPRARQPGRQSSGLQDEAREVAVAEPDDEPDSSHRAVAVRKDVGVSGPQGRRVEARQWQQHSGGGLRLKRVLGGAVSEGDHPTPVQQAAAVVGDRLRSGWWKEEDIGQHHPPGGRQRLGERLIGVGADQPLLEHTREVVGRAVSP